MRKYMGAIAALVMTGMLLAACGSDDSDDSSSSTSAESTGSAGQAEVRLDGHYKGTDRSLPTSAPKPQAGKNVWVIACGTAAEGCNVPAKAIKEAGGKVGWKVTVFDGELQPPVQSNGIRSAIADNADAIVIIGIDCPNVATAVKGAKDANIKVYGNISLDCGFGGKGTDLFDAQAVFSKKRVTYDKYLQDVHARIASDWVIAKGGDKANIMVAEQTDQPSVVFENRAFKDYVAKNCPDCKVTTLPFAGADLGTGNLKNIVSAGLAKEPSTQVVVAPYDAAVTLGLGPGVEQAERTSGKDILIAGYEGLTANMAEIKKGGPTNLATGFPSEWVGWQTVDELNRLFQDEPLVDEGMGAQAVDKEHNIPTESTYYDGNVNSDGKPKQDYKANFLKIWGVG